MLQFSNSLIKAVLSEVKLNRLEDGEGVSPGHFCKMPSTPESV